MAQRTCSSCGGSGKTSTSCPRCNGMGVVYNSDGSTEKCPYSNCNGGRIEERCSTCGGSGRVDDGSSDSSSSSNYSSSSSFTPSSSGKPQGEQPDVLIEQGNMWVRTEKYDGAISFYTKAINHPFCSAKDKSNAYEKRGYCYEQLKKHEQAVEDCTNAINIDNTIADAYLTRGFALIGKGFSANKEQAIANFKKAADLGSNTALKTLSQFGVQYTPGSGGYTLEAADLGNTTALENLADMGIKYIPAAIQAKENSSDSSVLWNLAFDYGKGQGGCPQDEAKAIELFTRVVEMDINYAYYLGNVYLWGDGVPKDQDKAIYWFEKAAQQGDHKKEAKKKLLELTGKKLGFFDKLFG